MGGSDAPMPYHPANEAGADSAYYSTLNGLTAGNQATYDTARQGYDQFYQNIVNNPYNTAAMSGVKTAAANENAAGTQAIANAQNLQGFAPGLISYGFDPQGANYNFGYTAATDAAKVNAAQAGIAGSPFGASTVNDAGQAFTRQWSQDQFTKAAAALQALQSLYGSSDQLARSGAKAQGAAAVAPQQLSYDINYNNIAALDALVNGMGTASKPLASDVAGYGQYLNIGQDATRIADQATQINNSSSGLLGGLGSLFGLSTGDGGTLGGDLMSSIKLF